MATDSRDWSLDKRDAWLWGIVLGWTNEPGEPVDEDPMADVARKHGWSSETVTRLRDLHQKFDEAFPQPWRK
jgi:hypothetical protein